MADKGNKKLTDKELLQVNGGTGQNINYFLPNGPEKREDGRPLCFYHVVKVDGDVCSDCIYNGTPDCDNGYCSGQPAY